MASGSRPAPSSNAGGTQSFWDGRASAIAAWLADCGGGSKQPPHRNEEFAAAGVAY